MNKRILIVLTSHDRLGDTGEKTGFWLEEFAAPYYALEDAGAEITLASPQGGQPPLDPKSDAEDSQTEATRRFKQDPDAQARLAATHRLAEMNADDFDAVFYPGGHGPLWDLVDDRDSIRLIEAFWAQGKPVSAVCHAPIVLLNARDASGRPIVEGREVTGFTNGEEAAVGLTEVVPQLVEDALIARGARYSKAEDFAPYTRQDGQLLTGQNPPSSEPVAERLIAMLKG
ncbi:type 1 glutamine amidotransferase domain-containing protein [Halomonas stenophila]|uniref:Putative intracellular protease/amidase n=1 Tax=Halomonas stenophila TaxID=795312 RepID=A0A7W5EWU1_9GAMM|nr:type 1 glutamine amidotransferase domain-containing protein [Halomonas stenophila]MBB3232141.1 putative intracellular protease/amidase [Halomonas stenophila]